MHEIEAKNDRYFLLTYLFQSKKKQLTTCKYCILLQALKKLNYIMFIDSAPTR